MSYILDALRRADAERERGAVPSIHAQPAPPLADDARPPRQSPVLIGVAIGLALALAGLLAWHWMGSDATPQRPQAEMAPQAPPPPTAQQAPPPTQAAAPPVEPAAAPIPPQTAPMAAAPTPPARPAPAAVPAPAPIVVAVPPPVRSDIRIARPPAPAAPAPAPAPMVTEDNRIYTPQTLPEDIRRDLPKLLIGGAMYAEAPANRMLIINSQIFHEGDHLMPDLLLQEIKLKSAVLKFKGYRYVINY